MYRHHLTTAITSVCLLLLLAPLLVNHSQAQTDERCFNETPYCISGRIREFWENNGGLPVFGFPTTPLREEVIEGQTYQVQWFERNRLELHPENARPYDVLLGRLGVDRLEQQGRDWQRFTRSNARAECLYFEQTGQNICEPFLSSWRASGLEFDGQPGTSEAESLALFGMPVSPPREEVIEGQTYIVQWFERTRFESHPENDPPYNVLFGLLGNEIRQHMSVAAPTLEPVATLPATPSPTGTTTPDASATPTRTTTPTATSEATSTPTHTASPTRTPTRTAAPSQPSPTLIPGTPLPSTLRVSQIVTASQVRPGQQFAYLLSATTSQEEQRSVVLRDVIDTRLELVSVSPANACTLNWDYNIVTCRLEIANGEPALVTVNVQVPQDMPDGTVIANQATLNGDGETTFSEVVRVQVRD